MFARLVDSAPKIQALVKPVMSFDLNFKCKITAYYSIHVMYLMAADSGDGWISLLVIMAG